jgi:hypothetical protein
VSEDRFVIEPFDIPPYWPRAYGMDVGWNKTAAVWGAHDRESDRLFLYAEHYMGKTVPAIHTAAIKARGVWIPGVIDPASRGGSQADGETLLKEYKQQGLKLSLADNSVEAGLFDVWQRLETDRLKVFDSLRNWLVEYRMYRRDDNGKVVKQGRPSDGRHALPVPVGPQTRHDLRATRPHGGIRQHRDSDILI